METKEFSVRDAFGLDVPAEITVTGRAVRGHFVPEADKNYQFRKELLSDLLAWIKVGGRDGIFLYGPTGAGKSSLVCQVAARLNIPVQRVTAHGRLEVQDLIGHHTLIDGDMVFVDGPLSTALRNGQWFLLDELDLLDPATAAGLNGIAEGAPLVIPENGGEIVKAHPGFRFIATGNTAGAGDGTGLYQGTLRQNLAFMDRFWVVEVGYPTEDQEKAILAAAVPDLPEIIRERMVSVANQVRKLFMGEGDAGAAVEVTFSTRSLVRWAQLAWFFRGLAQQGKNPVLHALDRALAFRAAPETRHALHEIVQRELGEDA